MNEIKMYDKDIIEEFMINIGMYAQKYIEKDISFFRKKFVNSNTVFLVKDIKELNIIDMDIYKKTQKHERENLKRIQFLENGQILNDVFEDIDRKSLIDFNLWLSIMHEYYLDYIFNMVDCIIEDFNYKDTEYDNNDIIKEIRQLLFWHSNKKDMLADNSLVSPYLLINALVDNESKDKYWMVQVAKDIRVPIKDIGLYLYKSSLTSSKNTLTGMMKVIKDKYLSLNVVDSRNMLRLMTQKLNIISTTCMLDVYTEDEIINLITQYEYN